MYQSYGCIEFLAAAPEQRILGNATRNNLVGPGLVVWAFSAIYSQVDTYANSRLAVSAVLAGRLQMVGGLRGIRRSSQVREITDGNDFGERQARNGVARATNNPDFPRNVCPA